jgi:hypothetical protein
MRAGGRREYLASLGFDTVGLRSPRPISSSRASSLPDPRFAMSPPIFSTSRPNGALPPMSAGGSIIRTISPRRFVRASGRVRRLAVTTAQADACEDGPWRLTPGAGCASVRLRPVTAGGSCVGSDRQWAPTVGSRWLSRPPRPWPVGATCLSDGCQPRMTAGETGLRQPA